METRTPKLIAGSVTAVYRIPYKRKRLEGYAILIRPIHIGIDVEYWEVEFTETKSEKNPWRYIWTAPSVKDEYIDPKAKYKKKGK